MSLPRSSCHQDLLRAWPPRSSGVDAGCQPVGVLVEELLEVGVVGLGMVVVEQEPGGVAAELPGVLDIGWLLVFDGAWGEKVLALGDAGPDDHGCDLALAVSQVRLDRAGGGRESAGELLPGHRVDAPGLEGLASLAVVHEVGGCVQLVS